MIRKQRPIFSDATNHFQLADADVPTADADENISNVSNKSPDETNEKSSDPT